MGAALFCGCGVRRPIHAGRMVCVAEEAVLESARLDIRPGVVGALHDDGRGRMARVEARRVRSATPATGPIPRSTNAQRRVDAAVLRAALDWRGLRRDCPALVDDCRDAPRLSFREPRRRVAAHALSCLGGFCRRAELHPVATQFLTCSKWK